MAHVAEKGGASSPTRDYDRDHRNVPDYGAVTSNHPVDADDESISSEVQLGIQKIEATTSVWPRSHLVFAYVMIWVIIFVDAMQQNMAGQLTPYVTSAFFAHSLTAATGIMSSLIGGLIKLPLAKVLDIWGRPQGFALMVLFLIVGLIMMAACNNVETYAAAQVFYWVGYNGMSYTLSIFIADTSALKNRALMFAFSQSPFIITVWIGGPLATAFLNGPGFRLGFATFAIITPVVAAPLLALFAWNYRKAKAQGLLKRRDSGRTMVQSIWYYAIEFDIVGILILATGLALFLLPFSLYSFQSEQWRAPLIIAFIVVGGVLLIVFALFEKFVAPKTFIPYELLTDRTVVGGCVLAAVVFVSFYMWDSYFTSFLQVVNGLTVTEASYVANIYSIGSCFFGLIVGAAVRITGRFKWLALYFGIPLFILGAGLMIYFRAPGINVGYLVMCQIFISFAGGTLVICQEMAVMAATSHQYIAVVLALQAMFSSIGGAVGSTVASAIWTAVFPARLNDYLPQELKANATIIYESLTTQLSYEVGTPARDAIIRAYGDAQKDMLIAATAVLAVGVVAVAVWRDIQVKDFKQVKGTVV